MKTIVAVGGLAASDPSAFREEERPRPEPAGREILVQVQAVGLNPVDTKIFARLAPGETRILGWDACGLVAAVGPEVKRFEPGDRVYYAGEVGRDGCNSEFQIVDEVLAGHAPTTLSATQAAAMPLTSLTAWEGLFDRLDFLPEAGANAGHSLLVVGGAGGVGSMLIQLGKWAGLTVIATAGRPESAEWCRKLGADTVIGRGDLTEEFAKAGLPLVEAIFCTTHMEEHWAAMAKVLAPQGRLGLIDDPDGPLDIRLYKAKAARICWEFMFARAMFKTPDMGRQGETLERLAGLVDAGIVRATLAETITGLTAANVQAAHLRQLSQGMVGKQVIKV